MQKEQLPNDDTWHILWERSISGVQICQFDMPAASNAAIEFPAITAVPGEMKILFCQAGHLLIEVSEHGFIPVEEQDILLVSDASRPRRFQISGSLRGILVTVDIKTACELFWSVCDAMGLEWNAEHMLEKIETQQGCVVLSDRLWTQALLQHIEHLPEHAKGQYCILKTAELFYLLCMEDACFQEEPPSGSGGYLSRSIADARTYMEGHLSEKLTIAALSHRFSISPTSLKSGFRQMYGMTIHRWLIEQRMRRARELLQSTDMTIQQIAQVVGYDGVSQFNVTFKKYYGVTPGQFTKKSETVKTCPFH